MKKEFYVTADSEWKIKWLYAIGKTFNLDIKEADIVKTQVVEAPENRKRIYKRKE